MVKRTLAVSGEVRGRVRWAARAVLGIGSAVAVTAAAGLPLPAVVTGGLAALLALFTVADATVGGQAGTTALLPVAGLPVLALAAWLHPHPLPRDAAFVAVVFAGVYARRWGARGHALGVFGFMMFFAAQFLRAVPAALPELSAAIGLGLGAAALVRFGLWCYERGARPAPAVALPRPRGLRHPATRQAVQAAVAAAVALAAGAALSPDRWYWAVAAVWWVFVNTGSRGETLVRGFRRVLGTAAGITAGQLVAVPLHGAVLPTALLAAVSVFGIFFTAPVSYSWMMFFVTVLVGLLYGLLGVLHPGLLVLRLEETAVGALAAAAATLVLLPITTDAATDAWIRRTLQAVRDCTAAAAAHLAGAPGAGLRQRVAELDHLLGRVRTSVGPLVHPLSPLRRRRARARAVLALLDTCAERVRALAAVLDESRPGADGPRDERLREALARVEDAVSGLVGQGPAPVRRLRPHPAHPDPTGALGHLHALELALADLAVPLGTAA